MHNFGLWKRAFPEPIMYVLGPLSRGFVKSSLSEQIWDVLDFFLYLFMDYVVLNYIEDICVVEKICAPQRSMWGIRFKDVWQVLEDIY